MKRKEKESATFLIRKTYNKGEKKIQILNYLVRILDEKERVNEKVLHDV